MNTAIKGFIEKDPFFIFDEHDLTDEKGKKLYSVTKQVLEEIAENNNKRIRETGDYSPIVIGHTKDGVSEDKQPKVVGYAAHYKVKPFFNTGRYAIQVVPFFDPKHIDEAEKYTRRSVEYWPNRKEIDPIALLGATTPERDLGIMRFDRNTFHYSRELDNMPADMEPDEAGKPKANGSNPEVEKIIKALMETDLFKFLAQLKQEIEGGDEADGAEGGMPPMPGAAPGGMPAGGPPIKESGMAPAPASGTNGFVPKQEPQRMSRETEDQVIRLSRQNQELATRYEQMARNLNDLNLKYRREQRKVDLIGLADEGYQFDMDEELDALTPLNDEQYKKAVDKMRKRYSRSGPVMSEAVVSSQRAVKYNRGTGRTQDQVDQIVDLATRAGISFDQAAEKLSGQGVL